MKTKAIITVLLVAFLSACGYMVWDSGVFVQDSTQAQSMSLLAADTQESQASQPEAVLLEQDETKTSGLDFSKLIAKNASQEYIVLGSVEEESEFKYEIVLDTKGASVATARLNGIFTRGTKDDPLVALKPVNDYDGKEILSFANNYLKFVGAPGKFPLYKLNWAASEVRTLEDGSQQVDFTTLLSIKESQQILKITKTYTVTPGIRDFACNVNVQNLSTEELGFDFDIQSAVGFDLEGVRADMRRVIVGFTDDAGKIESQKFELTKLRGAQFGYRYSGKEKDLNKMLVVPPKGAQDFLWAATSNKYFVSIVRPVADDKKMFVDNASVNRAFYYDAKYKKGRSVKEQDRADGSENVGYSLNYSGVALAPAGQDGSSQDFKMQIYLGPKDQSIFEGNETYTKFGYMHTIDFRMCCASLLRPLSLGILALMKTMHYVIPNYGIIIIILVLLVRLTLHPLTKKGQVSMMKMSKMGPKVEELKKRYGNDKAELNKRMMEVYKEQGASPVLGMLPMFLQMPIWFSLYAAIYASIDLRGASFLPFWITDLSAPDALFSFPAFTIPIINAQIDSFNLLPLLMGVAMFLQQKMMPTQASAAANPQMAQQQKMMLYMMPLMMLVFLYKAPSGLNLYIMTSIFGGVIEQKVIRKHIREKEAQESAGKIPVTKKTGGKLKKKKPKPFYKN